MVPGKVWEPSLPSKWSSDRTAIFKAPDPEAVTFFTRTLRCNLQSAVSLSRDVSTGCWLSTLLQMDAIISAEELDDVAHRLPDSGDTPKPEAQREVASKVKRLCASLNASVRQVNAFKKDCPTVLRKDYDGALLVLERILGEAQAIAEDVKDSLDTQHQMKSIQKSELAINESRSAIAGEPDFMTLEKSITDLHSSQLRS